MRRGGQLLGPGADADPQFQALRIAFLADPQSIHVQRWLAFFAERGHAVQLLAPVGADLPSALHPSVDVVRWAEAPMGAGRLPLRAALASRRALRRALGAARPQLLHAHYLTRQGWFAWLSGFHPSVVTAWGSDLLVDPRRSLRGRLRARLILRSADVVTAPSGQLVQAARSLGAHLDRVRLVPFGVDTAAFHPGAAQEEVLAGAGLTTRGFIFAPRAMRPLYRTDVVLRALALLPADTRLVMTRRGADQGYATDMEELARSLSVDDRIVILDEISDLLMRELYKASDAVVSVPVSDGLPISVLEAMASGTPVVISDLPGPREALGPGHDQFVAAVGDAEAVSLALGRVRAMPPDERMRLGARLRSRAVDLFDQREAMLSMERIYRDLVTRGSSSTRPLKA